MTQYTPPVRDIQFVLHEVLRAPDFWANTPVLAEWLDGETVNAILDEAGKLASEVIAPLNRNSDEQGCSWRPDGVSTPDGFIEAYQAYSAGGWGSLGGNPKFGGMGMPKAVAAAVEEMVNGASLSFGLYPMLTAGACLALNAHASEELKSRYLPKMYAGTWAGSMCLTEPHAGTDLGLIRTRAQPAPDGSFRVSGTKIFISGGEHDLTENIIHLVLAKLPDSPAGSKGISLFLVPKILLNPDDSLGARNAVSCGSIEHKMGIKGSATCVMNFDDAQGWLVGQPNKGLAAMFTMMNYERLGVGIQGMATGVRAYQSAVAYARDRLQGRAPSGPTQPTRPADPISVHPDVRRMLLTMKSLNEAARAFYLYVAMQLDAAKFSPNLDARNRAESLVALLTPVAKAFMTDMGFDATVLGQQVFGGHGYIREWGQEQLVRDCRITQIYEGTNGVQAMDLIARKVIGSDAQMLLVFLDEIREFLGQVDASEFSLPLRNAVDLLGTVTSLLMSRYQENPDEAGSAAVEYLHLFGYTAYAYMWARMMSVARDHAADDFYANKVATARFYFSRILPRIYSLAATINAGSASLYLLTDDQL